MSPDGSGDADEATLVSPDEALELLLTDYRSVRDQSLAEPAEVLTLAFRVGPMSRDDLAALLAAAMDRLAAPEAVR